MIASTAPETADCACCATSCATRFTRATGVWRLRAPPLLALLLPVDRDDEAFRAPAEPRARDIERFFAALFLAPPRFEPADFRPDDRPDEADRADEPRDALDFLPLDRLLVLFLLALRDEARLLPDFPRDFLALDAIGDFSSKPVWMTHTTIAKIRHIRKSRFQCRRCEEWQCVTTPLTTTVVASPWPDPYNGARFAGKHSQESI